MHAGRQPRRLRARRTFGTADTSQNARCFSSVRGESRRVAPASSVVRNSGLAGAAGTTDAAEGCGTAAAVRDEKELPTVMTASIAVDGPQTIRGPMEAVSGIEPDQGKERFSAPVRLRWPRAALVV